MGNGGWNGEDRREIPLDLLLYKVENTEKKIEKIDEKVTELTIGFSTMKVEMANMAKSEGKLSGAIYGIGGAILTAIIVKVVETSFKGG